MCMYPSTIHVSHVVVDFGNASMRFLQISGSMARAARSACDFFC